VPEGFGDLDGYLMRGRTGPYVIGDRRPPVATEQQIATLRVVTLNFTHAIVNGCAGDERYVRAAALAYEALFGYPPGQAWRKLLVEVLESDALHSESARRFGNPTEPSDPLKRLSLELTRRLLKPRPNGDDATDSRLPVGCTNAQMLAWIRHRAAVPAELTAAVIGGMRARVSPLGGGGGRGAAVRQSAARLVDAFIDREKIAKRMNSKKKRKRRKV
jgi:hypothetical protein